MQTVKISEYKNAADIPCEWDSIVGTNPYMTRRFLAFIEKTENDYFPVYYLFYKDGKADSAFIAYRRKKYNLTMFTRFNLKITVTMIYLPMCVTASGVVLGELKDEVFKKIKSIKGFKMILNLPFGGIDGFANGLTCPKCIFDVNFSSLEEYIAALRSDYRNRYRKVMNASSRFKIRFIDNQTEFDDNLYQLYLNVLNRSRLKIETLSKEYFKGEMFKVFVLEEGEKNVGFVQLLENGSELIFEFVGVNYDYNESRVYHRMLYEIIRYAAENGFKTIDFGQTADDTKLKLGSRYEYLYAALHHSSPFINSICKKIAPKIEYKPIKIKFNVYKK